MHLKKNIYKNYSQRTNENESLKSNYIYAQIKRKTHHIR